MQCLNISSTREMQILYATNFVSVANLACLWIFVAHISLITWFLLYSLPKSLVLFLFFHNMDRCVYLLLIAYPLYNNYFFYRNRNGWGKQGILISTTLKSPWRSSCLTSLGWNQVLPRKKKKHKNSQLWETMCQSLNVHENE